MHIFWESCDWPGARVEPGLTCLSWLPLPDSNGHGLLGSGSQSGSVGITRTDINPHAQNETVTEKRVNYNLRGHHSPISLVAWNQPQSKLATCDESGVIYVWVPYEERWSVELVNDRGVKVRDFSWSPNGSSALICYEDNFVLIGSSTGQRIWSYTYQQNILCGVWSPDSSQVIIGSNNGNLYLLTDLGSSVGEQTIWTDHPIENVSWSVQRSSDLKSTICLCFRNGTLYFMESVDDVDSTIVHTGLNVIGIQWTCSGEYLAVTGVKTESDKTVSRLLVYNGVGKLILSTDIPMITCAVTAFTWAHDDQCLVLAAGGEICVGRVVTEVPSLQLLSSHRIWNVLSDQVRGAALLPLPSREKGMVNVHNYHIIQCQIPRPQEICEAVCKPSNWRWFCTIRPVARQTQTFTLCMEHLSGLVPILCGRQVNKLLPEFEIRSYKYSPDGNIARSRSGTPEMSSEGTLEDTNLNSIDHSELDGRKKADFLSPSPSSFQRGNFQRDSVWRRSKRQIQAIVQRAQHHSQTSSGHFRKEEKLVQVTSNVWCTRFKLLGMLSDLLPPYLGQVVYKTSVLHLQPRQMTVHVVDLENHGSNSNPIPPPPPPVESETDGADENLLRQQQDEGPPIAPMESEIFVQSRDIVAAGTTCNIEKDEEDTLLLGIILKLRDTFSQVSGHDGPLAEEQALLSQVLEEFGELRSAVDRHIQRMRDFAVDLQQSSQQLNSRKTLQPSLSRLTESPGDDSRTNTTKHPAILIPDVIDLPGTIYKLEITSVLDKLYKLANELTTRSGVSDSGGGGAGGGGNSLLPPHPQSGGKVSPHRNMAPTTMLMDTEPGPYNQLRERIRDIAQRVSQLEKRINYGNELLDEVRSDLQRRVQHIRQVLGDRGSDDGTEGGVNIGKKKSTRGNGSGSEREENQGKAEARNQVLVLQNKAPFWNEQSQVYQLDFGGRVTQESAKNFQIEHADHQVMQFGRIDNGAYTLDFQAPFTAVQAFAVALASITQRLK